jgi:hypothetical protein
VEGNSAFTIDAAEIRAIAKAYDELLSYYETVGFEGDLDDEELDSRIIPDALDHLRRLLDRYAKWEVEELKRSPQIVVDPDVRADGIYRSNWPR